ncbi:Thiol-disulfide oxidoreductase ResA [subsurface metagenome]
MKEKINKQPRKLFYIIIIITLFLSCTKDAQLQSTNFELHDYTNKDIQDFYKGINKLIILNFWATYCSPCKIEMIDFSKLYNEYQDKVLFIGASIDSATNMDLIKKICNKLGVNYPIVYGVESYFNNTEITTLPKTFIIKNNKIIEEIDGKRDYNFYKNTINKYITDSVTKKLLLGDNKYFIIENNITKKDNNNYLLNILLQPKQGYYLNGEGYPPIEINIKEQEGIIINPRKLSVPAVAENQSFAWEIDVTNRKQSSNFRIEAFIKIIACSQNQCHIINEEFIIEF